MNIKLSHIQCTIDLQASTTLNLWCGGEGFDVFGYIFKYVTQLAHIWDHHCAAKHVLAHLHYELVIQDGPRRMCFSNKKIHVGQVYCYRSIWFQIEQIRVPKSNYQVRRNVFTYGSDELQRSKQQKCTNMRKRYHICMHLYVCTLAMFLCVGSFFLSAHVLYVLLVFSLLMQHESSTYKIQQVYRIFRNFCNRA